MKNLMPLVLLLSFGLLLGCDQVLPNISKPSSDKAVSNGPASSSTESDSNTPKAGEKVCFACKGTGTIKCRAPGCQDGMGDCPGPCLKLNKGTWVHMDVAGHPPTDLWMKYDHGNGAYEAFNQGHAGHVIVVQNGHAVDTGTCTICSGTGKVQCSACKGTGKEMCLICEGKKFTPLSWSPTNNPWLNRQPDVIRLTDGRVYLGKVMGSVDTNVTIRTRDGRWVYVSDKDLVTKPDTNSTYSVGP